LLGGIAQRPLLHLQPWLAVSTSAARKAAPAMEPLLLFPSLGTNGGSSNLLWLML
jgi:hypothetical protein